MCLFGEERGEWHRNPPCRACTRADSDAQCKSAYSPLLRVFSGRPRSVASCYPSASCALALVRHLLHSCDRSAMSGGSLATLYAFDANN